MKEVKRLKEKKNIVIELNSKNCDLTKEDSLEKFFKKNLEEFDQIFHLAVWTQAGDFCLKYPAEQWLINQKINTNFLSWVSKYQRKAKIICMGTSCAYDPSFSLKEENYLKGTPIDSLLSYGMTKKMVLSGLI